MNAILKLWMDVILLLTFQRDAGHKPTLEGRGERFGRPHGEPSDRSADW